MSRVQYHPYCLPLRNPWVASSATLYERRGWLVELTSEDGFTGWGDCAPLPSSGSNSAHASEMRWALETAQLDIEAQRCGLPLARLLGATDLSVPVNAALGPLDEHCAQRAVRAVSQGFTVAKIKVGISTIETELARLQTLVDLTEGQLTLRLDANCAWSSDEARRFLTAIAPLPVDAVEEPLSEPSLTALATLQQISSCQIAVDESLSRLGFDSLITSQAVRRLILKPARIGGMKATLTLAQQAQLAGMEVVITSVVDSAIGLTATAHLAAAVSTSIAHGLGTGFWLAKDVAPAPPVINGKMTLPVPPGLGISP
ncbi:MAG: o-succinylbenzoate synthase [Rhodocyclaceae bacterium]|nr:o-succinylbenzoate synthase [Rhodocyclaceae bacterium]